MMVRSLFAFLLLGGSATAAAAIDAKDLAPCKPAAASYCDNRDGPGQHEQSHALRRDARGDQPSRRRAVPRGAAALRSALKNDSRCKAPALAGAFVHRTGARTVHAA